MTETQEPKVQPWMMIAGKMTEIKIDGSIFVVRNDAPAELNPLDVARKFMRVFDTQQTALKRKAMSAPTRTYNKTPHKATQVEGQERVARINSISVFKEVIIDFYKKFPNEFKTADMVDYLHNVYPHTTLATAKNKANVYIKYMINEGWVELVSGRANIKRLYRFVEAPYGASLPVMPEFDSNYMKHMRLLEMRTAREL